jgi:protein SCO1/2
MLAIGILVMGLATLTGPYHYHGVQVDPPKTAPNFALSDQSGGTYVLNEEKGRVVALYFGFTNCPVECRAAMTLFKQVRADLGSDAGLVDFLFVTVDPARDNPGRMAAFLGKFDPSILGLTDPLQRMQPVWKSYGVFEDFSNEAKGMGGTLLNSTPIYLIDREGRLRFTYNPNTPAEDLQNDIRQMLSEKCPPPLLGVSC